jgi:hypothetical protein
LETVSVFLEKGWRRGDLAYLHFRSVTVGYPFCGHVFFFFILALWIPVTGKFKSEKEKEKD